MNSPYPLQSCPLFGGINDRQLAVITTLLKAESYPRGDYLFHQGDCGDRLFLIIQGRVEILQHSDEQPPIQLAIRETGDSIGEMCLIDIQNRSASGRALDEVEVLTLSHNDIHQLYIDDSQLFVLIIMNIAREISRRLRTMDALLGNALHDKN